MQECTRLRDLKIKTEDGILLGKSSSKREENKQIQIQQRKIVLGRGFMNGNQEEMEYKYKMKPRQNFLPKAHEKR